MLPLRKHREGFHGCLLKERSQHRRTPAPGRWCIVAEGPNYSTSVVRQPHLIPKESCFTWNVQSRLAENCFKQVNATTAIEWLQQSCLTCSFGPPPQQAAAHNALIQSTIINKQFMQLSAASTCDAASSLKRLHPSGHEVCHVIYTFAHKEPLHKPIFIGAAVLEDIVHSQRQVFLWVIHGVKQFIGA